MNAKAQQINHEVIGQHSSQSKGETMNTKMIKDSRKRFLSLTAVGLLTAVMSSGAFAIDLTAKGFLDITSSNTSNNNPRLSVTDPRSGMGMSCNSIVAHGTS